MSFDVILPTSSLFRKRQARRGLGGGINIVTPIGTTRRDRSCRVDGCLWAIEKSSAWCCCTFGAKTNVIGFGFGGTQVAISPQDNWIFYTASEKLAVHFHNRGCSGHGSPRLPPKLSLCADLLWSTEPPLSSAAASSTPPVLSGPRSSVMKPCACSLANSNSSIVGRSRPSSFSSSFALSLQP